MSLSCLYPFIIESSLFGAWLIVLFVISLIQINLDVNLRSKKAREISHVVVLFHRTAFISLVILIILNLDIEGAYDIYNQGVILFVSHLVSLILFLSGSVLLHGLISSAASLVTLHSHSYPRIKNFFIGLNIFIFILWIISDSLTVHFDKAFYQLPFTCTFIIMLIVFAFFLNQTINKITSRLIVDSSIIGSLSSARFSRSIKQLRILQSSTTLPLLIIIFFQFYFIYHTLTNLDSNLNFNYFLPWNETEEKSSGSEFQCGKKFFFKIDTAGTFIIQLFFIQLLLWYAWIPLTTEQSTNHLAVLQNKSNTQKSLKKENTNKLSTKHASSKGSHNNRLSNGGMGMGMGMDSEGYFDDKLIPPHHTEKHERLDQIDNPSASLLLNPSLANTNYQSVLQTKDESNTNIDSPYKIVNLHLSDSIGEDLKRNGNNSNKNNHQEGQAIYTPIPENLNEDTAESRIHQ